MEKRYIKRISVQKLFGLYDYEISMRQFGDTNLTILYGDNGVGKSTVLRIVYFLLSSKRAIGHKTALANIVFRTIEVELSDGTRIIADRTDSSTLRKGGYTLNLESPTDNITVTLKAKLKEWGYIVSVSEGEEGSVSELLDRILDSFKDLQILFISDNRKTIDVEERDDNQIGIIGYHTPSDKRNSKEDVVEEELRKLHNWIVAQAFNASQKGEEKGSELYAHILANITNDKKSNVDIETVKKELEDITNRASLFVNMGFMAEPGYQQISDSIKKVKRGGIPMVAKIVNPFITIQKNKLDALEKLVRKVSFLLISLNEYMYNKFVTYSVQEGFKISHSGNNEPIDISDLSSGEKQLLLLLSKVMRQSETSSLIIIDEPEISLNIKWQRKLMESMLYFTKDTSTQMLIATHSFEILSKHRRSVVKLENLSNETDIYIENGGNYDNL